MKEAMLTHMGQPKDRWQLDIDGETVLDTGSAVLVLKAIRRLRMAVPEVMSNPDCWNKDYCLSWDSVIGLWR